MKEIELAFALPIDWRGYLKFVLPVLLFGAILLIALGINAIWS